MRQAHPRHRHRRRRAIGPALVATFVGVVFLALGGPGFGRDAQPRPPSANGPPSDRATIAQTVAAVDRPDPTLAAARPQGTPDGHGTRTPSTGPLIEAVPGTIVERPPVHGSAVPVSTVGRGATAVFLGDSYTSGWNGAGLGPRSWPALVGVARGWKVVNLAVPGTGFMNPGWTNQPIASRVDAAVRQRPDIVFIVGGHNDSRWSTSTTIQAADRVIERLRAALPHAVIVIVGPIWPNASPPTRCIMLRAGLRTEGTAIAHTIFIDPLAERWFAGASHRYIGPDGLHPTNSGHAFIAQRVLADLRGT